jgi:hypothetical protein
MVRTAYSLRIDAEGPMAPQAFVAIRYDLRVIRIPECHGASLLARLEVPPMTLIIRTLF